MLLCYAVYFILRNCILERGILMKRGNLIRNFFYGVCMGTFEVVPGISGGTLAVLLNIYDKLIMSVSHIRDDFKNSVKYLLPIVLGMVFGIVTFSYVILFLNQNYPMETNFLLLGLIVGLIPMILGRAVGSKLRVLNTVPFFVMFAFMIFIICMSLTAESNNSIITDVTLFEFVRLILVGALASFCLLLPGCSGSMIMLVFGVYYSVMNAIHSFNILLLLPVGIGVLLGLLCGSRAVEFFFNKFPKATYFGILGLIVGSAISPCLGYLKSVVNIVNNLSLTTHNMSNANYFILHGVISVIVLMFGMTFSYLFTQKSKEIDMKK